VGPLFVKRGDRVLYILDVWNLFGTPGPTGQGQGV